MKLRLFVYGFLVLLFCSLSMYSQAQFFKKLGDAVTDRVERKVINDAGDAAVKGVDKAEKAQGKAAKKNKKIQKKEENTPSHADKENTRKESAQVSSDKKGADKEKKGMGEINSGYDFEPGKRALFETDFSGATVGNFPGNLEFRGGNMSVVAYEGGRALRVKTRGKFAIQLKEKLPEKFTMSFEVNTKDFVNDFYIDIVDGDYKRIGDYIIKVDGYDGTGLKGMKKRYFFGNTKRENNLQRNDSYSNHGGWKICESICRKETCSQYSQC